MRAQHDEEFAEFFHATWGRLYRTTYAVAGDAGRAEDALQAAFAKAYAVWPKVRAADHPEAYVRRMAINETLGTRRRTWFRSERSTPLLEHAAAPEAAGHEEGVVERDALWTAILTLPPGQRAVMVLRYYEDLDEAQIAHTLGCSRGTVKSQASAALRNLRRQFADAPVSPGGTS